MIFRFPNSRTQQEYNLSNHYSYNYLVLNNLLPRERTLYSTLFSFNQTEHFFIPEKAKSLKERVLLSCQFGNLQPIERILKKLVLLKKIDDHVLDMPLFYTSALLT